MTNLLQTIFKLKKSYETHKHKLNLERMDYEFELEMERKAPQFLDLLTVGVVGLKPHEEDETKKILRKLEITTEGEEDLGEEYIVDVSINTAHIASIEKSETRDNTTNIIMSNGFIYEAVTPIEILLAALIGMGVEG